jgi:hypothetical protein
MSPQATTLLPARALIAVPNIPRASTNESETARRLEEIGFVGGICILINRNVRNRRD